MSTDESSPPRRSPTAHAPSREALLKAARELLLEEGYAAVTARRVAARAGLKPQLVHYYFASMDDLFVQLVRRAGAYWRRQLDDAASSPQPLRALWEVSTAPGVSAMALEYAAVANHRKAIAAEVAAAAEQFRLAQHEVFRRALAGHDVDLGGVPLGAVLLTLEGLARLIVMERHLGAATFHDEALQAIEELLCRLEGPESGG